MDEVLQNLYSDLFDILRAYLRTGSSLSFENHVRNELWKRQFAGGYKLHTEDPSQGTLFNIPRFGRFCFDLVVDINTNLLAVGEIKEQEDFSSLNSFYYFCGQTDILSAYLLVKQKSYDRICKFLLVTGETDWRILTSSMYFGVYPITRWTCHYYEDLSASLVEISTRSFVLYGKCSLDVSKDLQQASALCSLYWLKKILERGNRHVFLDDESLIVDLRFLTSFSNTYKVRRNLISTMELFRHIYSILESSDINISSIVIKIQRSRLYDSFLRLLLESMFSEKEKMELVREEFE